MGCYSAEVLWELETHLPCPQYYQGLEWSLEWFGEYLSSVPEFNDRCLLLMWKNQKVRGELVHPVLGRQRDGIAEGAGCIPTKWWATGLSFPFSWGVSTEVPGLKLKEGCLLGWGGIIGIIGIIAHPEGTNPKYHLHQPSVPHHYLSSFPFTQTQEVPSAAGHRGGKGGTWKER